MRILVVAAHPDDETIGAGILLRRWTHAGASAAILHVTDGAPQNLQDAHAAGFPTGTAYAAGRRAELAAALAAGDVRVEWCRGLEVPDQRSVFELPSIAQSVAAVVDHDRPDAVVTHPYEGGHPDHDATAFAVAAARRLTSRQPAVFEMSSYHFLGGVFRTATFLPVPETPTVVVDLTSAEREIKRAMIDCFRSQRRVLRQFGVDAEALRRAPAYDFTLPPHPGRLHYEHFDWGTDGAAWRERARQALRVLSFG